MRIALFTGNYHHVADGVALTLNRLVRFLEERGHTVLVFAPVVAEPAIRDHAGRMVPVPSFPMPGRPEYRIPWGLDPHGYEELRRFDPDLIHLATPDTSGIQAILWAMPRRIPLVASFHTYFTSYMGYYNLGWTVPLIWRMMKWFYGRCEAVFVPSESMMDTLREQGIDQNLKLWARGVDTDRFSPDKRNLAWRRLLGFADDDVVVTFVSRLVWEKDLDSVAKVFNALHDRCPKVKTLVVGEGPAGPRLQGMMPHTLFAGFFGGDDLAQAYASSDVFFFPSTTETFGNVTLEALASGLPSVVADAPGGKSLVRHRETGYIVTAFDVPEYTRVIGGLVENHALRARMSAAARASAFDYTWERINGGLLAEYERIVGGR